MTRLPHIQSIVFMLSNGACFLLLALSKLGVLKFQVIVLMQLTLLDLNMLSPKLASSPLQEPDQVIKTCPSLEEFQQLWATWDVVSQQMISQDSLLSKPINLRNCCLFYLGHIPTFLDTHVAKALDGQPSEPTSYRAIFERGIDPDVENPELCHAHSETPDTWPNVEDILQYQKTVRSRVTEIFRSGQAEADPRVAYALWIGFEHEGMQYH